MGVDKLYLQKIRVLSLSYKLRKIECPKKNIIVKQNFAKPVSPLHRLVR